MGAKINWKGIVVVTAMFCLGVTISMYALATHRPISEVAREKRSCEKMVEQLAAADNEILESLTVLATSKNQAAWELATMRASMVAENGLLQMRKSPCRNKEGLSLLGDALVDVRFYVDRFKEHDAAINDIDLDGARQAAITMAEKLQCLMDSDGSDNGEVDWVSCNHQHFKH